MTFVDLKIALANQSAKNYSNINYCTIHPAQDERKPAQRARPQSQPNKPAK